MSFVSVLESYKTRVQQIAQAIANSAAVYAKAENDLKQHLANHNALLGAQTEAQNVINTLTAAVEAVAPDSAAAQDLEKVKEVADTVAPIADAVEEALSPDAVPAE